MDKLQFSKRVTYGDLLSRRGDKYIRCGKRAKPVGILRPASVLKFITMDGQRVTIPTPEGIQFYGFSEVRVLP